MKNMYCAALAVSMLLLVALSSAVCAEMPASLVMATLHEPNSYGGMLSTMVYQEAFRRLGIELILEKYPPLRGSKMAEDGAADGEVTRSYEYLNTAKNLIRVEEPLYMFRMAGYALKPVIQLDGWDSLKGITLRIDYRRGLKELEQQLSELVDTQYVYPINTAGQGLKKLLADRCDLYIDLEEKVAPLLATPEFKTAGILDVGAVKSSSVHGYLHKKHQDVVPELERVIRDMKQEGLIEQYQRSILEAMEKGISE